MPEQIPAHHLGKPFTKWELTIRDTFSMAVFYKMVHDYLAKEEWKDLSGGDVDSGGDDYEDYYSEKVENGGTFWKIWWRATKRPFINGNKYYQMFLLFDIDGIYFVPAEVIHNGKKVKLDKGELKVSAQFFLVDGHGKVEEEWNRRPILKFVKKRFWERENRQVLEACQAEIMRESNNLYELIQTFTGVKPEGDVKDFVPPIGTHF